MGKLATDNSEHKVVNVLIKVILIPVHFWQKEIILL
jgi:hypothetical protein